VKSPPRRQPDLFQAVWQDHSHLVRRLAHKLRPIDANMLDDLVAAGMVGLWQAWQNYDPTAGNAGLWGHASTRVLGAMQDHLRFLDLATRHERDVARQTGREVPERSLVNLDRAETRTCDRPSTLHEIALREVREAIRDDIDVLPRHLAEIVVERYFKERPLLQIGNRRGYSESRACQLVNFALAKLRKIVAHDPRLADTIRELS
jgi:RNA polymerase sigma factor (sigma-70 family)